MGNVSLACLLPSLVSFIRSPISGWSFPWLRTSLDVLNAFEGLHVRRFVPWTFRDIHFTKSLVVFNMVSCWRFGRVNTWCDRTQSSRKWSMISSPSWLFLIDMRSMCILSKGTCDRGVVRREGYSVAVANLHISHIFSYELLVTMPSFVPFVSSLTALEYKWPNLRCHSSTVPALCLCSYELWAGYAWFGCTYSITHCWCR